MKNFSLKWLLILQFSATAVQWAGHFLGWRFLEVVGAVMFILSILYALGGLIASVVDVRASRRQLRTKRKSLDFILDQMGNQIEAAKAAQTQEEFTRIQVGFNQLHHKFQKEMDGDFDGLRLSPPSKKE